MWAFIIMAFGGFCVVAGAYFQYRNRIDDQKSALIKEQTRQKEAEAILTKATDIIYSQKKVIDQITGGDGYPFIHHGIHVNQRAISFRLQNKFEYPIYDLKISYTDPVKLEEITQKKSMENITESDYEHYHIVQEIGNVPSDTEREIFFFKMPETINESQIVFVMNCRNGHYLQTFKIIKDEGYIYIIHGKLEKVENGKVVKEILTY